MYQKTLIGSSKLTVSSSELFLDYYLIKKKMKQCEEDGYGIRITVYDPRVKTSESEQVYSIFTRREDVESLCYILMLNQVTPVTLWDIIEDYIL